jgi:hypothetical protein
MDDLNCGAPIQGGCKHEAREVIMAMPSIDASGPMRVWAVHLRCGISHTAENDAKAIRTADPGATVLTFATQAVLEPGNYAGMMVSAFK